MSTLVFLPGFMCDARLFAQQRAALSDIADCHVQVPLEASITNMAEAALHAFRGPLCVAGLSMGGIVALEMLRLAPDRITRLALMDTTPLADAPENHAIRTRQIADIHAGRLDLVMRDELKPAYLVDSPDKSALLDLCLDMARALGPDVFEAQATALRDRNDLRPALDHAPRHTLILCGAEDRLCPPARHDMMHALAPHSRRLDIPNAGHLPTLEQPGLTTAALKDWMTRP